MSVLSYCLHKGPSGPPGSLIEKHLNHDWQTLHAGLNKYMYLTFHSYSINFVLVHLSYSSEWQDIHCEGLPDSGQGNPATLLQTQQLQ